MNGFERRKQNKMQQILDAAEELFQKDGVNATAVADIAKRAGVSQVSIYNYFGSKDGLLLEVLRRMVQRYVALADNILEADLPFLDKLTRMVEMKKSELLSYNPDFFLSLFQNQTIYQYVLKVYEQESLPRIKRLVAMGKAEGAINPALSDEAVVLYTNIVMQAYEQHSDKLTPALWSDLLSLFVFGFDGYHPPDQAAN